VASAETDWAVQPDELPDIQTSASGNPRASRPRQRRIVPVKDGENVVGYKFAGDGRPRPMVVELPQSTGLGEMV
jgi:hypothetical protein